MENGVNATVHGMLFTETC